jgi:hypothetical protein
VVERLRDVEESHGVQRMTGDGIDPNGGRTGDAAWRLFGLGLNYYIAGRGAAMAGLMPIAGNLLHHAVEMLIKADLSKSVPLNRLKAKEFGHKLPVLWDAFKPNHPAENLGVFDELIHDLDRFERIRYPDAIMREGAAIAIGWGTVKPAVKTLIGPTAPEYFLYISEIDSLVARMFLVCNINPKFYFAGIHPEARRFLEYQKPISEYWLE